LNNPELGRTCDHVRPGLRRMEYGRHVLFYRIEAGGIIVYRTPPSADAARRKEH
jgi:toxin ParE1/3/4